MSKLTEKSTRNPDEIRAEIAHHKDEIANSIAAARDGLHADEVLEASVDYVTEKSSEAYNSARSFVRENPVPVALASAGLASLVVAGLQMRAKKRNPYGYSAESNYDKASRYANDKFSNLQDSARGTVATAERQLKSKANSLSNSLQSLAQNRPVLTACIGAAIGAAIGGALPRTEFEDETFGPVRDQSISSLQHSAEQLIADTKEAVTHSIDKNVDSDLSTSYASPKQTSYS